MITWLISFVLFWQGIAIPLSPEALYDQKTRQKPIYTHEGIDKVLNTLKISHYKYLSPQYRKNIGLDYARYHQAKFYVVRGEDIFKYVVGKFRLRDFMPKDKYYAFNLQRLAAKRPQYLLIDKAVLHKFLDLMLKLEQQGYNKDAFDVRDGYRHPANNRQVGGAPRSLHTYGKAIDVVVKDIDRDGKTTQADKQIALRLLDKHIIGKTGGLGRYPGSLKLHFDVRGWHARWDKH